VELLTCPRCNAARDRDDNFCRRCGRQITVNLPAARDATLPAPRRAVPPSVVNGVALLALGTGLEWLARRMAAGAAGAVTRAVIGPGRAKAAPREAAPPRDDVAVDEFLFVRQVRLKR
jgi:hypothetical protein